MVRTTLIRIAARLLLALALLVAVGANKAAPAATVDLGGFTGSETLVDFSGLDVPATPSPIVIGNLTVDSPYDDLRIYGSDVFGVWPDTPLASGAPYLSNQDTTSTDIELSFATPVKRVGMWMHGGNESTSWTISAFDASDGLVGSHTFEFVYSGAWPGPGIFAGVEFATAFSRVTIVETLANGQYTNIDDIRFEAVPEPSTAVLVGAGLVFIAVRRKRRGA